MNKFDYLLLSYLIIKIIKKSTPLNYISLIIYFRYLNLYKNCFTIFEKIVVCYVFEKFSTGNNELLYVLQYHLINCGHDMNRSNIFKEWAKKGGLNQFMKSKDSKNFKTFLFTIGDIFFEYINNYFYFGITLRKIASYIYKCILNVRFILYWGLFCVVFIGYEYILRKVHFKRDWKPNNNIKPVLSDRKTDGHIRKHLSPIYTNQNNYYGKQKEGNSQPGISQHVNIHQIFLFLGKLLVLRDKLFDFLLTDKNFRRKKFHFLFFILFFNTNKDFAGTAILIVTYTLHFLETHFELADFYHGLVNDKDPGMFVMSHVVLLTVTYFILQCDNYVPLLISICVVDSAASIAGLKFKQWKHEIYLKNLIEKHPIDKYQVEMLDYCPGKTPIGSVFGFLMGNVVHFMVYKNFNYFDFYLFAAVVEFYTSQNDNIVVPFFAREYLKSRCEIKRLIWNKI